MILTDLPRSQAFQATSASRKRELTQFLADAARTVGLIGEVSVLLTGDRRIRELNRQFRGKDEATDVLSFAAPKNFGAIEACGDLAISLETASRQAVAHAHPLDTEIRVLMLHGLLHLAGYDHETDGGRMARRERSLRKRLALPCGLLERSGAAAKANSAPNRTVRSSASRAKRPLPSRPPRQNGTP